MLAVGVPDTATHQLIPTRCLVNILLRASRQLKKMSAFRQPKDTNLLIECD